MGSLVYFGAERAHKELVEYGHAFQISYEHLCDVLARADHPHIANATPAYLVALIRALRHATSRTLAPMHYFLSAGAVKNSAPHLKARLERLGDASSLLTHDNSIRALMDDIKRDSATHIARLRAQLKQCTNRPRIIALAQYFSHQSPPPTPVNDNKGGKSSALKRLRRR